VMTILVYLFCILLVGVVFYLPQPWGLMILLGILLGAIINLADRVSKLEDRLGVKQVTDADHSPAAEAERRRLAKLLAPRAERDDKPN